MPRELWTMVFGRLAALAVGVVALVLAPLAVVEFSDGSSGSGTLAALGFVACAGAAVALWRLGSPRP